MLLKSSPIQGEFMDLVQDVPLVCIWKVQDVLLKPCLFRFHRGELPIVQMWKIRMEWEFIWNMVDAYLSSKGESPLAFF